MQAALSSTPLNLNGAPLRHSAKLPLESMGHRKLLLRGLSSDSVLFQGVVRDHAFVGVDVCFVSAHQTLISPPNDQFIGTGHILLTTPWLEFYFAWSYLNTCNNKTAPPATIATSNTTLWNFAVKRRLIQRAVRVPGVAIAPISTDKNTIFHVSTPKPA